ncbi:MULTISPECIES: protein kinase [unclassified Streptomyces]|uniref:serine/threonine-protein kinase n=1 Tax=unclassified Streptomyces TaxID=2593676 RepID=UPI002473A88E|nr:MULTISPECIES: protein kinase [unclassified Streptomyces]MDH6447892.1 tRNA A-37 threonylcarbamoyl transferase component Bud32 [Streptomyces sp. SAI-119]MDH6501385.1 tRNA A-37 threonylcarbamoyl transferase component Bud32 [Streptomyces sp. SAI-149]
MSSGETNEKGQDEAGRLLAGRYRVMAQLGRGGMGVVWRAVDEVLGREVAVKELRTYTDADGPELADLRLRMQREARAAARVRHPGVVAVHDVAEVDGRPLIVMEMVDGPSLDAVLRKRGPLDPREAAEIGAKVMDALAAAHAAGVLHRDVKPGNILLDRSGRVLLTDFGIATMEDPGDGSATNLTRTGHLVGSLDYMAPERAQGADPGPASDVWALGATLYAAVEGASPFRRTSTFSTLTAIVGEPLPESHRAGPLAPVLRRLLDKRPEARPGAEEARGLLQAVADGAAPAADSATTTLRDTAGAAGPAGTVPHAPTAPVTADGPGPVDPTGSAPAAPSQETPGAAQPTGPATAPVTAHPGQGSPGVEDSGAIGQQGQGRPVEGATGQAEPPAPWWVASAPQSGGPAQASETSAVAQGPGPVPGQVVPQGPVPGQPGPAAHSYETSVVRDTRAVDASRAPRRNRRVLLAAAAVAVVLAVAGTAVTLMNNSGKAEADARPIASGTSESATASASARTDDNPSGSAALTDGDAGKSPSAKGKPGEDGSSEPTNRPSASSTAHSSGGGSSDDDAGGGSGDGGTGGDSDPSTPAPAPACTAIGGGKYNCTVWKTATSYTASGDEAGILKAGTNYFFCQSNLGRRETSGAWTNVWWAKTDDDSGNTGVYVSDVYIKGGNNDEPVPGLPVC